MNRPHCLALIFSLLACLLSVQAAPVDTLRTHHGAFLQSAEGVSRLSAFSSQLKLDSQLSTHPGKVGLVLSGGGAKGIGHIGVIQALEDAAIPIDYIVGTSMGAVVGSLYACGMSPAEMMTFIKSPDFNLWATGTIAPDRLFYFDIPQGTPAIANVNLDLRDSVRHAWLDGLRANLVNPIPMNFEFMRLFAPYTVQCRQDFDSLMVPFRCVYSDIYHKHKVIGRAGDLGDNVRASMSFPFVFEPIKMHGVLVYDGGIYDNFPVNVIESEFNPGFIVGVSVSGPDGPPIPGNVYSQLEDMIIQNNDYSLPADKGVKIQVPVLNFGVLDFDKADEIYAIGYSTGLSFVDSIRARTPLRRGKAEVEARRQAWKRQTPVITFDSVAVIGVGPRAERFVEREFAASPSRPLDMTRAEQAYYTTLSGTQIASIMPHARLDSNGRYILDLRMAPGSPFRFGAGGWLTSSQSSMLYLSAGWQVPGRTFFSASLSGWIGQSYGALYLSSRLRMPTQPATAFILQAAMTRKKMYAKDFMFYDEVPVASTVGRSQNYVKLGYEWAIGRHARGAFNAGYALSTYRYYSLQTPAYMALGRDRCRHGTVKLSVGADGSTLNDEMYPTAGQSFLSELSLLLDHGRFQPHADKAMQELWKWETGLRLHARYIQFFTLRGNFFLGIRAEGVATFGPLYENYVGTLARSLSFSPLPTVNGFFNRHFRGTNWLATGVTPVFAPLSKLQVRSDLYAFANVHDIASDVDGMARYDGWFKHFGVMSQLAGVVSLPFASLTVYGNYLTHGGWNFGVALGLFFEAPDF